MMNRSVDDGAYYGATDALPAANKTAYRCQINHRRVRDWDFLYRRHQCRFNAAVKQMRQQNNPQISSERLKCPQLLQINSLR